MGVIPDPTADLRWSDWRGAIHQIFDQNARKFPDRPCIIESRSSRTPERVFTYRQINEASNKLAHFLLGKGCQRGDVTTVYAYRGVELVCAYYGVLKAGGVVNVLDPQYPADRQKILLEVADPRFLIHIQRATEESGKLADTVAEFVKDHLKIKAEVPALKLHDNGNLIGGEINGVECLEASSAKQSQLPDVVIGPDSNPTLSFTSGSEGKPKGVLGRHFSLTYYTPYMAERFGLGPDSKFSMLSGIAHDPIQRDIFTPLFLGASLYIPPREKIMHELLAEWMKEYEITTTHLTPAMGQILVGGASAIFPKLTNAFFVGDLLTRKDSRRLQELAPNCAIQNMYGTTETQRAVSFFEIPSRNKDPNFLDTMPEIIPVGSGMSNVQLLVVDRETRNRICDIGEQGELFLRAGGLAEGYRGESEDIRKLNETKFLRNWFVDPSPWVKEYERRASEAREPWMDLFKGPRDRLYRTGDLGRMRPDGAVECTGRIDNQVKIRGFRIELGDIDANLSQHPFVRENITMVRRNEGEEPILVSYIVPEAKRWFEHLGGKGAEEWDETTMSGMLRRYKSLADDCRKYLQGKLPHYSVPTMFIPLTRFPLNPNGKIDRPALPFPTETDLAFLHRRASRSSSAQHNLTETQKKLAALWAEILPNHSARMFVPESNFFEEGGHSILAQLMLFKVRKAWKDIDIPMSAVFQSPTLEGFAGEIDRAQDAIGLRLDAGGLPANSNSVQDEAYGADADELLKHLPQSIKPADVLEAEGSTVFMTGVTGFLGSYILRELLQRKMRVIALVRSADPQSGLARIEAITKAYGLVEAGGELQVVTGDISKMRLGMSSEDWEKVTTSADIVIHNGAQVNWMYPYSSLRKANVLSTLDCIGLCSSGKAKRFVFVSSTSALDSEHYIKLSQESIAAGGTGVQESDDLEGSRKGLATGYGQSKWASERITREAFSRGLVGAIVRPGYIVGDPKTGISITDDFVVRLLKGCLQLQARPNIQNSLNAVPVTQVSKLVVGAALYPSTKPVGVIQVTGHPRITIAQWLEALHIYGYEVSEVSYPDWVEKLQNYVSSTGSKEEHALLPLFHFVAGNLPADSFAPELDDKNAESVLKSYVNDPAGGDPLSDSVISIEACGMYLAYLVKIGFLQAPAGRGERELPELDISKERLDALSNLGGRGGKA